MSSAYQAFLGGKYVEAKTGQISQVINPANGKVFAEVAKCGIEDVESAVNYAKEASSSWAAMPMVERSKVLLKASRLIMERQQELAELETSEHGSPLRKTMNFDVPMCAEQLEYFASVSRALTGETLPVGPWCFSATVREPLGIVGLITPWNFPALMVAWKLGAALVTGNTCIVKPPSIAPLTTLKLAEILTEAGAIPGSVNVIPGPGSLIGEAMVTHPDIAKIGFTGDTATGKQIMKIASDQVKQVGLELGGKNAFIVLPDADIDAAVEGAVFSAFFNSGQVCAAASRFYLHDSIYDEFSSKFVDAATKLQCGDPLNMDTTIGPVAYFGHRDKIEEYISEAQKSGAKLLLGGERPSTAETVGGAFVTPTIFGNCEHHSRFMRDEIFGPVVGLCRYNSVDDAIGMANDSPFGLSASVWTRNSAEGLRLAHQLRCGTVWINEHLIIFCDTPWGGCKQSGWGKDLSTMALKEYTMTKHIYLDITGEREKPWYGILK